MAELKQRLVEKTNITQERQRIIYKGRVLENDQRLEAHGGCATTAAASSLWLTLVMTCWQGGDTNNMHAGVQQGHSLHLVERAPTAPAPGPAAAPAQVPGQAAGQFVGVAQHHKL